MRFLLAILLSLQITPPRAEALPPVDPAGDAWRVGACERAIDLALFLPDACWRAVARGRSYLRARDHAVWVKACFTTINQPKIKLGSSELIRPGDGRTRPSITGQPISGGPRHAGLARTARLLAVKFGTTAYVSTDLAETTVSAVFHSYGPPAVVFRPGATRSTQAHELTHARNTFARDHHRRFEPNTIELWACAAAGHQFAIKGYRRYFRADEIQARAVEIGIRLHQLRTLDPTAADAADRRDTLIKSARQRLSKARRFEATLREETELMRALITADGGRRSLRQIFGSQRLEIRRPAETDLPESSDHFVRLITRVPGWRRSRPAAASAAWQALAELDRFIDTYARIFAWQERQLDHHACAAGLDAGEVD